MQQSIKHLQRRQPSEKDGGARAEKRSNWAICLISYATPPSSPVHPSLLPRYCATRSIGNSKHYNPVHHISMSLERYKYIPLSGPRKIRLLKLHYVTSRDDPEVSVELVITFLDTTPRYTALSYAWGDPLPKTYINCSGSMIAIGANLHSALRHLRPNTPGEVLHLWADALCINQEDLAEKNAQVRIMSDIYATATITVIWLGLGDDYVTLAFHWLRRFQKAFEANKHLQQLVPSLGRPRFANASERLAVIRRLASDNNQEAMNILRTAFGNLENRETVFQDIWMMLRRPWFTRKWVLQEVRKSNNLYFVAGYEGITWKALNKWFLFLLHNNRVHSMFAWTYPPDSETKYVQNLHGIYWLAGVWSHHEPLISLQVRTLTLQCSDPRDHIFALSSLASDFSSFEGILDYGLSTRELSHRLTCACLVRPADLVFLWSILSFIPLERRLIKSWVPNLQETASLALVTRSNIAETWNRDVYATAHTNLNASPDGDILRVKGRIVDVIEQLATDISASAGFQHAYHVPVYNQNQLHLLITFQHRWIEECYGIAEKAGTDSNGFFSALLAEEWLPILEKEHVPTMRGVFPSYRSDLKRLLVERNEYADIKTWRDRTRPLGYSVIEHILSRRKYRRFGRTHSAAVGWMPKVAERGDHICMFDGIGVPYAIRRSDRTAGNYVLVGECFISGLEDCQTADMPGRESVIINLE